MSRRAGGLKALVQDPRKILEPTLLLALLTGTLYVGGYAYYSAYFEAFGLSVTTVDITTPKLLMRGFLLAVVFVVLAFIGLAPKDEDEGFIPHLLANGVYILTIASLILDVLGYHRVFWIHYEDVVSRIIMALLLGGILVFLIVQSWRRVNFVGLARRSDGPLAVLLLAAAVGLVSVGSVAGSYAAESLAAGEGPVFALARPDGTNDTLSSDRGFLLVAHEGGLYFLAERGAPALQTKLLIVPDAAVILRRIG